MQSNFLKKSWTKVGVPLVAAIFIVTLLKLRSRKDKHKYTVVHVIQWVEWNESQKLQISQELGNDLMKQYLIQVGPLFIHGPAA